GVRPRHHRVPASTQLQRARLPARVRRRVHPRGGQPLRALPAGGAGPDAPPRRRPLRAARQLTLPPGRRSALLPEPRTPRLLLGPPRSLPPRAAPLRHRGPRDMTAALPSREAIARWLPQQRWFGAKARRIDRVTFADTVWLGPGALLLVDVELDHGGR